MAHRIQVASAKDNAEVVQAPRSPRWAGLEVVSEAPLLGQGAETGPSWEGVDEDRAFLPSPNL